MQGYPWEGCSSLFSGFTVDLGNHLLCRRKRGARQGCHRVAQPAVLQGLRQDLLWDALPDPLLHVLQEVGRELLAGVALVLEFQAVGLAARAARPTAWNSRMREEGKEEVGKEEGEGKEEVGDKLF